ncbi:MAG: pyridoxal-phosphate dependent enzyme [Planctomycetota bacterium]|nr:MAG: pyridoxal-phosphate dependent enzyme [Planctomycetota bacterium]
MDDWPGIDFAAARERLRGVVERTPLAPFPSGDPRIELRLKLECLQVAGAFKARGAWNQVASLPAAARRAGVVATSSGNHAGALAWAAQRAGVPCTVFMPADAYPNKVAACRERGARVELRPSREEAEAACAAAVAAGATLVHPYDAERTLEGAGTVALEVLEQWPEVEVLVCPVGGGGLIGGCALAAWRERAARAAAGRPPLRVLGVEPAGAPSMTRGLAAGRPVKLERIDTRVQGLCPLDSGALPIAVAARCVDRILTLPDEPILAAQSRLVRESGWTVEPAGAAAPALVLAGALPPGLLVGRTPERPLRVAAVVSGGNPDPAQLAGLLESEEAET